MRFGLRKILSVLVITFLAGFALAAHADSPGGTASPAAASLNLQTPIEQLVDDPGARDVLDRVLPGLTNHRMYETFKSMSLEALQGMAPNLLTPERLSNVADGLAQLLKQTAGK